MAAGVLIMFGTVLGLRLYQRYERAKEADRLFAAGQFKAAHAIYLELEDEEGAQACVEGYRASLYHEAEGLVRAGNFEAAEAILNALGPYGESDALLRDCDYLRANALAEKGETLAARELYLTLGDYPGCAEQLAALTPALYDEAKELARNFRLAEACELWKNLTDYKDSAKLLVRAERALSQLADKSRVKLNDPSRRSDKLRDADVYICDDAYILFPEKPNKDTRFFLYFPGGRDEEINLDFLFGYMANPAPNTLAIFLRRNHVPDMDASCERALRLLDAAAADCGLFPETLVVAGSSLGAYPALQCPRIAVKSALRVSAVLSLDAGNAWNESDLVPRRAQCEELAKTGAQFYLFQPVWEDMDYDPVRLLVETGNWVMLVGCLRDDHELITYDAMGMGVIDWALTDPTAPCPAEIYSFRRLRVE